MTQLARMDTPAPMRAEVTPMIAMIERVALDPSASIEKLEQMLALKERMDAKDAERAFAAAFSAASAEFPMIPLNGKGHNAKPYALLKDIIAITRPILASHGLILTWNVETTDKVKVTAKLAHRDGHSQTTSIVLPADASGSKNAVQAFGSTQTYGQRYTAQAILGLSLGDDVDDDGKGSTAGTISDDQFIALRDLMEQAGGDESKFMAFFKIQHLEELPTAKYGEADAMLRKKIKAKAGA